MAYAPHSNTDVKRELHADIIPTVKPLVLGSFRQNDNLYEFAERRWPTDFAPDMPHVIYVGPYSDKRLAKVLKTVAYIVTDENENGEPVIEKWDISKHNNYDTSWVR